MASYDSAFGTTPRKPFFSATPLPSTKSMADSLPAMPLAFAPLRDIMNNFKYKFDNIIDNRRKALLSERNDYLVALAENKEEQRQTKSDIELMKSREEAHARLLEKERKEKEEFEAEIERLAKDVRTKEEEKQLLERKIADAKRAIDEKVQQQRAHAAKVQKQSVHDLPELEFWASSLGLRIEGAGATDHLKFIFCYVDERDWEREAWFEIITDEPEYRVGGCYPKLEKERVARVMERMNERKELGVMLKGMRELFVEAMKT